MPQPTPAREHPAAAIDAVGLHPPPRPAWVSPVSDWVLSVCFVVFLVAPLIFVQRGNSAAGATGADTQLHENRALAKAPVLRVGSIASLPGRIEAYYDDRFGFRANLVRSYNIFLRNYLKASNGNVVLGKEGWLFYARDVIFPDFFGKSLFSEDELKRLKEGLEHRRALWAQNNTRYLFVVAPNKNTIYPEFLPDYIREHQGRSRLQQLREYLRTTESPLDILDLHEALLADKPKGDLYFRQETHWNGRGHFTAYEAICRALSRWFPEIKPQVMGRDYALRPQPSWEGDEWKLLGVPEEPGKYPPEFLVPLGTQRAHQLAVSLPPGITLPRESRLRTLFLEGPGQHTALIFHDSFMRTGTLDADHVALAENFARTLLFWRYPSDSEIRIFSDWFHPDVVIEETVERVLPMVRPFATEPKGKQ